MDIKNDYYFFTSKIQTSARIEELKEVKEYKTFVVTLNYYNIYLQHNHVCTLKLDGHYGRKLNENLTETIQIFYTKQSPCDVYIIGNKCPTVGALVIHLAIFVIVFAGSIMFTKQLFSKE